MQSITKIEASLRTYQPVGGEEKNLKKVSKKAFFHPIAIGSERSEESISNHRI